MQDDARADLLFRILAGEDLLQDHPDDAELRALAELGSRLDTLRPTIAALDRAEQAFNPIFAQGLHRTLVATHPAAPPRRAVHNAAHAATRTAKRLSRRFLALLVLLVMLLLIVLGIVIQGNRQAAQVGTAALTATPVRPGILAKSFAANAPQAGAPAGGRAGTAAPKGTASSRLGSATFQPGAQPTPTNRSGTQSVAGGVGPNMDTIVPRPAIHPGSVRYQLPSKLPRQPSSVPLYQVRRLPISVKEARAIAASFTGMGGMTGTTLLSFSGGGAQLVIDPATGAIDFIGTKRAAAPAESTPPLPDSRAVRAARAWLNTHHLLPQQSGALRVKVTRQGVLTAVRFTPALELPLGADAQSPVITVRLDAGEKVVSAHAAWAQLKPAGTAAILPPSVAVSPAVAPPTAHGGATVTVTPLLLVTEVKLLYQTEGQGAAPTLRPVYQLTGMLGVQTITRTVPASRSGT